MIGSLPYGLLGILGLLYFRIDTILLSYLRGNFETEIAAGTYILELSDCNFLGCQPKTITIEENKTAEINIDIDTGIR